MEQIKNSGERTFSEMLFDDSMPKTKMAVEQIINNNSSLTKEMVSFVNVVEGARIKTLISEWLEIIDDKGYANLKSEQKSKVKEVEKEFATILETAFDREN